MSERLLRSYRFRQAQEAQWRTLESLLGQIERGAVSKLSDDQLLSLPQLYRNALSSLSVARATSLDRDLIDYLESLCTQAYFFVYGPRSTLLERVGGFLRRDWPAAVQGLWRETAISVGLVLLGAVVAYVLTLHDPDWYYAFVPKGMSAGRDPSATTAFLRSTLHGGANPMLPTFATFLFTHNAQIAVLAFALGFACCLPTAMLMIYNGCTLGAVFALFGPRALGPELGGWLFIHGVTELFAVTLAGAAGLRIGWRLVFPGARARLEVLAEAGRQGAVVMFGVIVMLFVAGCLEGIGRQLIDGVVARYAIALTTAVVWGAYFYWPGRGASS
jgi:uncharacterized membrane protein SpoIIM required for sporulation